MSEKKVAVLLDGAFVLYRFYYMNNRHANAQEVVSMAMACLEEDEELFRIYYYDCPPYDGVEKRPFSNTEIDFYNTPTSRRMRQLHDEIAAAPHVAFRAGVLSFDGWSLSKRALPNLISDPRPLKDEDLDPKLRQKRVDIKIGLDIAWLSTKHIVDRIILVTSDSDFIPAMKFARREGVQVVLVTLGSQVKRDMLEHADEVRVDAIVAPSDEVKSKSNE
jgi:uncharacterized LabA/DUF88 family protein